MKDIRKKNMKQSIKEFIEQQTYAAILRSLNEQKPPSHYENISDCYNASCQALEWVIKACSAVEYFPENKNFESLLDLASNNLKDLITRSIQLSKNELSDCIKKCEEQQDGN